MDTNINDGPETQPLRRAFLTEAGEPLVVPCRPIESAIRYQTFRETTGLDADHVYASWLTAIPLPTAPPEQADGSRRWAQPKPEIMWLPLMWLPERLVSRYQLTVDGQQRDETIDEWAVRVCLELTTSGMYDETTGSWVDILALVGLDIDSPDDMDRVSAWMRGATDSALDSINLDDLMFSNEDPDWAVDVTVGWLTDLETMAYATCSESLIEALQTTRLAAASPNGAGLESVRSALKNTINLAGRTFRHIDTDSGEAWNKVGDRCASHPGPVETLIGEVGETVEILLADLHSTYWPRLENMAADTATETEGVII